MTRTIRDRVPARISKRLTALGVEVYSTCLSFANPRNGNLHNPTPRLLWTATLNGKIVSTGHKKRDVLDSVEMALLS